jgi:hypothetical protein
MAGSDDALMADPRKRGDMGISVCLQQRSTA